MASGGVELPRKEANVLKGHEGPVLAVRFNGDGNYCLSCGKDRTLRLWNPNRGIHIKTYKSHGREIRDVHVTSDNAKLCSCGGDRQIFYWDVSTGRVIRKFRGHDSEVNAVKFNAYDSVVVSAGYDQSVRAWDCRSQSTEPIQIIDTFQDSVMSVCLTKTEIIAGSVDGTVRTFDIRIGRELVDNLGQAVNCISLSNDGNCVLASCLDSTLRLLDRSTGELLQEYKGHTCKSYKMDCCLTNTDAHVTGGSEDGTIFFWDLVDASVVSSFKAHRSVMPLPYEGNGVMTGPLIYIVGGEDDSIMVEEEGEVADKFEGSSDDPTTNTTGIGPLSFATWATRLRLAIAAVKAVVLGGHSIPDPRKTVTSVNYHPKECCMLTSSVDGTVRVWKP